MKLLMLDVDGILTDGKKYYGVDGMPFMKTFSDKDWTSIKRFRAVGVSVIFITGDNNINPSVAKNRNIPVYLSRGIDKLELLPTIKAEFNCDVEDMAFVGDDLFDVRLLKAVAHSFCTADAPQIVKDNCKHTLSSNGGDNVVLELFELCERMQLIPTVEFDTVMTLIEELDKKEVF